MIVSLKSTVSGKVVTMWDEVNGQHPLVANRDSAGIGEQFEVQTLVNGMWISVEDYVKSLGGATPVPPVVPTNPEPQPPARDAFDVASAIQHDGVYFGNWPATSRLTLLDFRKDGVHVEFDKKDTWPDVVPSGWSGPLQYSLGMAMNIGGTWHMSAPIQFWKAAEAKGGNVGDSTLKPDPNADHGQRGTIAVDWFYDANRWGPLCRQPAQGETVAFFVVAGSVRGASEAISVRERSNVVLVKFPGPEGDTVAFGL